MQKYKDNKKKYSHHELKKGDVMVDVFGNEYVIDEVEMIDLNPPLMETYPVPAFQAKTMFLGQERIARFNLALWAGYKREDLPSTVGKGF